MVSGPSDSVYDFCENILSIDRFVCHCGQQTAAGVLHEVSRPCCIRHRCSIHRLVGYDGLCIPSSISSASGTRKDQGVQMPSPTNRSVLAQTPMVSSIGRPNGGSTSAATQTNRPTSGSRRTRVSTADGSATRAPPVDCLEIIRQRSREEGFSEESARFIAAGRRDSTLRTYSQRLGPYYQWCRERDISPTRATVTEVADFLTDRFESGIQANTVRNYKSAILSIHRGFPDGTSLNDGGRLALLLDGMFNIRPSQRLSVPVWNLDKVLHYLGGPPFEPMAKATLKNVTIKTVFLVTVASGRRCSEIHALSASAAEFTPAGVRLYYRPDFLAKNESANFQHPFTFLPRIGQGSSVKEDKVWCPVRSLAWYIDKTTNLRKHDQLFLTHAEPHGPAAKRTLARWLVKAIQDADASEGHSGTTAHSTRTIASSWAYHRGLTVQAICDAVAWKAPNTFTSVYRNVRLGGNQGSFARAVLGAGTGQKHTH